MEILYGILIAALMGGCAFCGFILGAKTSKPEPRYVFPPLTDPTDAEIERKAFDKMFNIEDPPRTAEGFAQKFTPRTPSERLKHGTRER